MKDFAERHATLQHKHVFLELHAIGDSPRHEIAL